MALTITQALSIVRKCIKAIAQVEGVEAEDVLEDVGFPTQDRVNLLRRLIVVSETIGVPSKKHTLNANHLAGMKPDSSVGEVADVIKKTTSRSRAGSTSRATSSRRGGTPSRGSPSPRSSAWRWVRI
jgi:hypothetical protein